MTARALLVGITARRVLLAVAASFSIVAAATAFAGSTSAGPPPPPAPNEIVEHTQVGFVEEQSDGSFRGRVTVTCPAHQIVREAYTTVLEGGTIVYRSEGLATFNNEPAREYFLSVEGSAFGELVADVWCGAGKGREEP